jgi:threonyl-tRNA synthetase
MNNPNELEILRHSASHVLAAAALQMFPEAKFGIGPAIENGFYYDFELPRTLIPEDLEILEMKMKEIIKKNYKFEKAEISIKEAQESFKKLGQNYKLELIEDLKKEGQKEVSVYKTDAFVDLCRGPHLESTGEIKADALKLTRISGAYWKGDQKNSQLQRIYGVAFASKKDLAAYLDMQKEAEKRDHRKIGAEQELFTFSSEIGSGLVLWLPKGNIIKEELEKWAKETEEKRGYARVTTPVITKENLFYTSEHLPHYKESMYSPMDIDGEKYYLKPMNCPFHHTIFKHRKRSYRELPLRLAEYGWCHRYEDSGSLFGLMRVRGMQMNDAHIYCTKEQAVQEFVDVIRLHEYYYKQLNIEDYYMELALRNPENKKYHGDDAMWQEAEDLMKKAMELSGVPYVVKNDGAAFYGPKIDFQIKSKTGRLFTASTNQIDLFMPKKFELKYTAQSGQDEYAVCIHRAPLGTHERFIGFLIEHFAGAFPTWLSPVQVKIIPVSEKFNDYGKRVFKKLSENNVRVEIDNSNESLGKRIREAEKQKIPYMLIVGEKEEESGSVAVRARNNEARRINTDNISTFSGKAKSAEEANKKTADKAMKEKQEVLKLDEFIEKIKEEIKEKK